MRQMTTVDSVSRFMSELGKVAPRPVEVFFTGGVTAILHGWRPATVDIDLSLSEESDEILRALPRLKEQLGINVELASPPDFIPEVPGWRNRSIFIRTEGLASFFHYDPYSQALSKIERAHQQDVADVQNMFEQGLIDKTELLSLFEAIVPELFRYPAIDPPSFRRAVEKAVV